MKRLAYKIIGTLLVIVYNEEPPTDAEMREGIRVFQKMDLDRLRCLIVTKGGAPTAAQRKQMNDLLAGREFNTAVVSDANLVRGVVTAVSWFNKRIRSFPTSQFEEAFKYLDIPSGQFDLVRDDIRKLQAELDASQSKLEKVIG